MNLPITLAAAIPSKTGLLVAMKQIKVTLIYLAIIPAVIAFNFVYTSGMTFYADVQTSKAKVVELEARLKKLEPQPPAPVVAALATETQFPIYTGQNIPLPSPMDASRSARTKNPPVDLSAVSTEKADVPAAGQFTLAGESSASASNAPKFVLAGDK